MRPIDLPPPRSKMPGVAWPAIGDQRAASILSLLWQFMRSERLPPARLRALQFRQLHAQLAHAVRTAPYYAEILPAAGFDPARPLTEEIWARLPLLTRSILQEQGDRLRSTEPPPAHGAVNRVVTSGSTSQPVAVWRPAISQLFWDALTLRDHLWQRRDFRGSLASIRYVKEPPANYPNGLSARSWGRASATLYDTGPSYLLDVRTPIEQQIEWLRRRRPDYLLTYPSNLAEMLRALKSGVAGFPPLKGVATVSESLSPELRDECRAVLGVGIGDVYSCQEIGYLAMQCSETDLYHEPAETVLVEVLDDDNRPVAPGGIGRVVATPLHGFAMPLLRYELGDMAEVGGPCACGRGLPVLSRIVGRYRNAVRLPGGQRGWAMPGSMALQDVAPVRQFQIVQHALDDLELKLVAARPLTAAEEDGLTRATQAIVGHPLPVRISLVDSIPRSASGKFETFVCRITD